MQLLAHSFVLYCCGEKRKRVKILKKKLNWVLIRLYSAQVSFLKIITQLPWEWKSEEHWKLLKLIILIDEIPWEQWKICRSNFRLLKFIIAKFHLLDIEFVMRIIAILSGGILRNRIFSEKLMIFASKVIYSIYAKLMHNHWNKNNNPSL